MEVRDLIISEKIDLLTKNRRSRGGGVALAYDKTKSTMRVLKVPRSRHEVLACEGTINGIRRPVCVIVIYVPPKTTVKEYEEIALHVSDVIELAGEKLNDPYYVITGDFNERNIEKCTQDFPEIIMVETGPTRGNKCLDLMCTNFRDHISDVDVLPPLEDNLGENASDHRIIVLRADIPKRDHFTKKRINFRPYTQRGEEEFGTLLLSQDWSPMEVMDTSEAADWLTSILEEFMEACFPEKARIVKSSDYPWISQAIKRKVRQRNREYARKRRSNRWKILRDEAESMMKTSQEKYLKKIRDDLSLTKNTRHFFKAVQALTENDPCGPKTWSINDMFPGENDEAIAEKVAGFFNKISQEYEPLERQDLQPGISGHLCPQIHEIASRLHYFRKPKSRVRGDIFPELAKKYSDILAIPLHYIFSKAFTSGEWPAIWQTETVTVIPKVSNPTKLAQLRNLSCTPLFSKLMESFVLEKLKMEVKLSESQFGGIKGSGVDNFLIETWDEVLKSLEDRRASVTLASIDFEKAFNRVCHHQCLAAARRMGASEPVLAMLRGFLTSRTMSVKINGTLSTPRPVPGGSPQGSILANFLFCLTTDQLNSCLPRVRDLNRTVEMEDNGRDASFSSPETSLSPIHRPESQENYELGLSSEEEELRAGDFLYFNPRNRIEDSVLSIRASQNEIDRVFGLPDGWEPRKIQLKVYIDDMNSVEKISNVNAVSTITTSARDLLVHSPGTEDFFVNVAEKAEDIGMIVNQEKTQILCISSSTDQVSSYIRPTVKGETKETRSGKELKILGFWFGNKPNVSLHVKKTCEKFRSNLWALRKLRRTPMKSSELLNIYCTVHRPVIEFASPTYGPMLTSTMSQEIEGLQMRVMRIIYGPTVSYAEALRFSGTETLMKRRSDRLEKFARKNYNNPMFRERWFPAAEDTEHNTRMRKKLREEQSTTDRLYRSPLFTMRRLLNRSL